MFDALGDDFSSQLDAFLTDTANRADLGWRRTPQPTVLSFARALADGAWRARARYDELLERHVPHWSVGRMQPVDRNILRLGLHELLEHPDTPPQVILNEAVELAQLFGGNESPAFVNGVLDGIRRELPAARAGPAAPAME